MNKYKDQLISKRVLVMEYLETARNVGNDTHAALLESDLRLIDRYLKMDHMSAKQFKTLEKWLGYSEKSRQ